MKLSSKWVVAELCSLIFVENMKKQRQEVRNSAKLKWWSGMDEKVAVIKIWSWNPQFLLELKNSFFLGSKNDKTMLTLKQITLRGNEMARQSNEDHWHFFFAYVRFQNPPRFFVLKNQKLKKGSSQEHWISFQSQAAWYWISENEKFYSQCSHF